EVTARRRIECRDKRVPRLAIDREGTPVGQPLFGLPKRRVEHEFAHGLAFSRCRGLQSLLCGAAQSKVELLGAGSTLAHFASWFRNDGIACQTMSRQVVLS